VHRGDRLRGSISDCARAPARIRVLVLLNDDLRSEPKVTSIKFATFLVGQGIRVPGRGVRCG